LRVIRIRPLGDEVAAWDAFVMSRPEATFFHLAAWRAVIGRAFRHKPYYVLAEQDGAIVGVLPLVRVKTLLFGDTLISNPFCVYGGILAVDDAASRALADHAAWLRARMGSAAVELRYLDAPREGWLGEAWVARPALYVTFRRAIVADEAANLKAIPRKQRAVVRKAIERGLSASVDGDVDTLHAIFARSVRNLGTPVFAKRYFRILAEAFGSSMDILTVRDGGRPVASVMNFYFRDQVIPYYGGGTEAARRCGGNDFMYWEVMRRAAARGCRLFDFGRSKAGTGAFAFKKNFGFAPSPLHYRVCVKPGGAIPEVNPNNPKYRLMIKAWKFLPLPVANRLGPILVRGTG
jgi:FemAB-related protein (PEP-CTERM system-associated)